MVGAEVKRLGDLFCGDVDDGDGAVARICSPEFAGIGRNVGALGAFADRDVNERPSVGIGATLKQGDGVRADVGGEQESVVFREDEHMSTVLADAE